MRNVSDYVLQADEKVFKVTPKVSSLLDKLVRSLGGEVKIVDVGWSGIYSIQIKGNMITDSEHVAKRTAKAIHRAGGSRIRIHKIGSGLAVTKRKTGGYRQHQRVVTH